MESLISLAFDNLSSRDTSRIRKGLRQIEGLLAQICLQPSSHLSPHKRARSDGVQKQQGVPKQWKELRRDAAFREFFRLQEGFRWNVASRLIATLERLMGMGNASQTDLVILSTLDLLQGLLLLHPPSRCLFNREDYMNLLLDLLDSFNPPKVQSQALLVLVTALLDCPSNTRTFESVDGLLTVTSLFKSRGSSKEVKMRTLEFLYFYLMPEAGPTGPSSAPNTGVGLQRSPSKRRIMEGHHRTHSGDVGGEESDADEMMGDRKSTEEKQHLLGQHLSNVADLVRDLQENAVFGSAAAG